MEALQSASLSSVTFIHDYLQLTFYEAVLTLFKWPVIHTPQASWYPNVPGYSDVLRAQIGQEIVSLSISPTAADLRFKNEVQLLVSLQQEDQLGREAGYFSSGVADEPTIVF